jgi:hypothetical protein
LRVFPQFEHVNGTLARLLEPTKLYGMPLG